MRFRLGMENRGREETEIARRARNIETAGKRERFAGIDRLGARELLEIPLDEVSDAQENS